MKKKKVQCKQSYNIYLHNLKNKCQHLQNIFHYKWFQTLNFKPNISFKFNKRSTSFAKNIKTSIVQVIIKHKVLTYFSRLNEGLSNKAFINLMRYMRSARLFWATFTRTPSDMKVLNLGSIWERPGSLDRLFSASCIFYMIFIIVFYLF